MDRIGLATDDALTRTIAARLLALWEAYRKLDTRAHNAILADDYTSIHADGTFHDRKPTAQEIAAGRMTAYTLTELRAVPVGSGVALANYVADAEGPVRGRTVQMRFIVGEVWIKKAGVWKCRYFQGTLVA
ncbi:MAG TPA: nuclear transport factor 2 family protein [Terriglobia bacterium]|nr:nuclear transport factor 2 family protein [Terriglobia bacterium]